MQNKKEWFDRVRRDMLSGVSRLGSIASEGARTSARSSELFPAKSGRTTRDGLIATLICRTRRDRRIATLICRTPPGGLLVIAIRMCRTTLWSLLVIASRMCRTTLWGLVVVAIRICRTLDGLIASGIRICRRALGGLIVIALGCGTGGSISSHPPPCPEGALDLPARSEAVLGRLGSIPEGAALIEASRDRAGRMCFAPEGPNAITDDRTIVLDRALGEAEAAARVAHLLVHVRDGSPYPERARPGADCDATVARALDREARAHAVELEVRRALGVRGGRPVLDFEEAYWAAAQRDREGLVRRALEADGEGLALGYRQRCERESAE